MSTVIQLTPRDLVQDRKPYVSNKAIQKTLLITTVVFGALSLIPPLRFAGSMGLRATAFLSSCNICAGGWTDSTKLDRAILVGKVTLVALGVIGAVLACPAVIVASVAADTALQIKALVFALGDKKYDEALVHLAMILINALVIAAIVAGSWKLIVAAGAISATLMLGLAVTMGMKAKGASDWLDVVAYVALTWIGIAGCITMAQLVNKIPEKATFDIQNSTNNTRYIYGKEGHLIATLAPGESVHLELPYSELSQMQTGPGGSCVGVLRIETPDAPWYLPSTCYRQPNAIDYITKIRQLPIAKSDIPFTPLSSTVIVTKELESQQRLCSRE